jgi:anhydro-N-acetylmuramic acid kinase
MIVAGVMSGTSADGIDVALVRLENSTPKAPRGTRPDRRRENPPHPSFELLGHAAFPYPASVRDSVLKSMNAQCASVADLARLNFLLAELFADAVVTAQKKLRLKADLVGCHGQTIYHQGEAAPFLGRKLAVTWQIGEGAVLAVRLGVPVVSDFRPADMAAGGKGAPLVPYLDYLLYRDNGAGRIALNIGGIANVTAIPVRATPDDVIAFDTGPGNMVIDAMTQKLFGKPYDRNGRIAAAGRVLDGPVSHFLRLSFFRRKPPKTAGREEFGREFAERFWREATTTSREARGHAPRVEKADVIRTATVLTARSISDAVRRYVLPRGSFSELIASGGGAKNPTLMASLAKEAGPLGLRLRSADEFGIPSDAKEAVAFAVLAFETWNRRPSNVPAATGARQPAVLGKVSYP